MTADFTPELIVANAWTSERRLRPRVSSWLTLHDSKTKQRSASDFRGRRAAALVASDGHSAVHDDFRARDEAGLIRGEEQSCIGGVAAVTREADGNAIEPRFEKRFNVATRALPGKPSLNHRRVQLPGNDRVNADTLVGILDRHHARQLNNSGFRRGVTDLRGAGPAQP